MGALMGPMWHNVTHTANDVMYKIYNSVGEIILLKARSEHHIWSRSWRMSRILPGGIGKGKRSMLSGGSNPTKDTETQDAGHTWGSNEMFGVTCLWAACLEETNWKWSQKQAGARLGGTVNVIPRVWTWYYTTSQWFPNLAVQIPEPYLHPVWFNLGWDQRVYFHQSLQAMHSHGWDPL